MRIAGDIQRFLKVKSSGRLLAALIVYGIGTGILAPMNAVYLREQLSLSKNEIAAVFAVSLFLNMLLTLASGFYSDRLRRKKALPMIAAAICMVGLVLYMRAQTFGGAMAGMATALAPSGMIMGQLFAMARNHYRQHAGSIVEMAMLWLRTGYSVGFFGGLLLGANVYLIAGFGGVLWGNLAGYAGLLLLLLVYREASPPASAAAAANRELGEAFSPAMLLAILMLSCADAIRGLYLPLLVNERFGRPAVMSYLWSAQAVFELLFMTLAGYWAARFGSARVIALGGACAIAVYAVYAASSPIGLIFAAQPVYSLFVSVLYGVAMGYVQRMFIRRTGFGASLFVFISQAASLIGYLLPVAVRGISPAIFLIPAALTLAALLLIAFRLRGLAAGTRQERQTGV
ncbi:MFS transporter [Cohnella zeiphila]|uniref:MFS transporter n=1 Tax=Cohnella zeiphila TaxID=2761120 RepID=A0A7X0SRM8_9BACL|nr:MFS transporter [Cohnella zeiphila]MBB6733680.1 MFS transporter [Cohnella zeiphila]